MTTAQAAVPMSVTREPFGEMPDGRPVERVRLRGAGGFEVCVITFGAAIQALYAPDRHGRCADIVLGHETLEPYLAHRRYFGAAIGRYANRIAGGAFGLDGARYRIAVNDGPNALHGGLEGFDRKLWVIEAAGERPSPFVTLSYLTPITGFHREILMVVFSKKAPVGSMGLS